MGSDIGILVQRFDGDRWTLLDRELRPAADGVDVNACYWRLTRNYLVFALLGANRGVGDVEPILPTGRSLEPLSPTLVAAMRDSDLGMISWCTADELAAADWERVDRYRTLNPRAACTWDAAAGEWLPIADIEDFLDAIDGDDVVPRTWHGSPVLIEPEFAASDEVDGTVIVELPVRLVAPTLYDLAEQLMALQRETRCSVRMSWGFDSWPSQLGPR